MDTDPIRTFADNRSPGNLAALTGDNLIAPLLDHAGLGLAVVDPQLRFQRVNTTFAAITGIPESQIPGRSVREVLGPMGDHVQVALRRVLEFAQPEAIDLRGVLPRGKQTTRDWRCHYAPVKDAQGRVIAAALLIRDVTALRAAQRRATAKANIARVLASSDSLHEAAPRIVEAFAQPLGVDICEFWVPIESRRELTCAAFYAPTAPSRKHALKHTFEDVNFVFGEGLVGRVWETREPKWVTDLQRDKSFARTAEAAELGLVSGFAFPILLDDRCLGVMTFFTRQPFEVDDVLLDEMAFLGRKIGEFARRANAERALRESEELYRQTFDNAALGISHVGIDGQWLRVNERLCEMVGYSRDELVKKTFQEITHPDDLETDLALVRRLLAGEIESYALEKRYIRKDGSIVWIHLNVSLIQNQDKTPRYFIAAITDISRRKALEESLRKADQQKNQFLAVLAHELRNPLGPIRDAVHLMSLMTLRDERLRELRDIITRQVGHMTRMIDDLFDVSRIARGKIHLLPKPLDLVELVRTAVEDRRPSLEQRGLTLRTRYPDAALPILGDATRLTQVVGNLLHNASKFTDPGGHISVHVEYQPEVRTATVTFTDNGKGMDQKSIEILFEPFQQAGASLHHPAGGMGLGLALVKGFVELHGGTVRAHSDGPGTGATFVIALPVQPESTPPQPPPQSPEA